MYFDNSITFLLLSSFPQILYLFSDIYIKDDLS